MKIQNSKGTFKAEFLRSFSDILEQK